LSPENLAEGREVVRRQLDAVGERLADGRPFLLGDEFTAADLTFAAMSAICVLPPQYGSAVPPLDLLDEAARQWVTETREHPAGQFALRLYERRPPLRAEYLREHAPIPAPSDPV
jgi:glutathione S-transferase